MKTDILLNPMGATYPEMRMAALAVEPAGFDGIWTWDHLRNTGGPGTTPEGWTVLSALSEVVPRLVLGPLVLNVINRHPALLANMAATLQEASGGRLILGLGAGGGRETPYAVEQRAMGQEPAGDANRARRLVEAIAVIRRLWAGDTSSFEGEFYTLERPTGFLRPSPLPPMIVGAFGPRMARLAGEHADGLNTQAGHPQLAQLVETSRAAHAGSARAKEPFLVTAFAGLSEGNLRPSSRQRQALEALGVDRLILLISPPYSADAIRDAGQLLRG